MRALLVGAMAGLAALPGVAGAQTAPPLSAYSRLPAVESAALSTDGARLAYVTTSGDKRVVEVRPANAAGPIQRLDVGAKSPRGLTWVGPDHMLLLIHQTLPAAPGLMNRQQVTQAISYDAAGRRSVVLFNGGEDVLPAVNSWPRRGAHQGAPAVLVEGFNPSDLGSSMYRVDARSGRGVKLDDGKLDSLDWLARPDGTLVAKSERTERGPWVLKLRRNVGWAELVRLPPGPDYPQMSGFGRDGSSLLLSGGQRGEPGLFEVSMETGAWSAVTPPGRMIARAFFADDRDGRLVAAKLAGGGSELLTFDPVLQRTWASVRKSFPGKRVELIDRADDNQKLVVRTFGADDPGGYYLFDYAAKKAELIGDPYPELSPTDIAPVREVTFAARDGATAHGVLTLPRGRAPKGLPLVLLAPSTAQVRQNLDFDWMAQALASRGYAVMTLSGRDAAPGVGAPVRGSTRKLLDDSADAVRFLAAEGVVDGARVCGVGRGLGGWAAVSGVTLQPVFRCAVSLDGVLDLRREAYMLRDREGGGAAANAAAFEHALGVSGPGDAGLNALSPAAAAGKGRAPVLLVYAADNLDTPPAYSRGLEAALKAAGRPVETVAYAGEEGRLEKAAARDRVLAETVRFLLANNPPN
jgi:dipeptidyl aminopeptidase/acylaminoacyl peptidase